MATETAEIVYRRSDTVCSDPTEPLCLGTNLATDDPVMLSRTERFDPIHITGRMEMGSPTAEGVQEAQVRSLPRTESCHGGST